MNQQARLSTCLKDNRIVDIGYFTEELLKISEHPRKCTLGKYVFQKEIRNGLSSDLVFFCNNCEREYRVSTTLPDRKAELNDALVWGATSVGIGFSQAQEMMTLLNIPIMSDAKYRKHEAKIGEVRHDPSQSLSSDFFLLNFV